jgi:hypothetical protein
LSHAPQAHFLVCYFFPKCAAAQILLERHLSPYPHPPAHKFIVIEIACFIPRHGDNDKLAGAWADFNNLRSIESRGKERSNMRTKCLVVSSLNRRTQR